MLTITLHLPCFHRIEYTTFEVILLLLLLLHTSRPFLLLTYCACYFKINVVTHCNCYFIINVKMGHVNTKKNLILMMIKSSSNNLMVGLVRVITHSQSNLSQSEYEPRADRSVVTVARVHMTRVATELKHATRLTGSVDGRAGLTGRFDWGNNIVYRRQR